MFSGTLAPACYVYVPLEVRIAKAQHVVEGEISAVAEEERMMAGTLKVTRVIKGPKVESLKVLWPKPHKGPGIIADGPVRYKRGQKGMWILTHNERMGGLFASYPGDFSGNPKAEANITAAMKRLTQLKWTKEGDLEWAVLSEIKMQAANARVRGPASVARGTFYPLVRNRSDKVVHLFNFAPLVPFKAKVVGPDGRGDRLWLRRPTLSQTRTLPAPPLLRKHGPRRFGV